MNSNPQCLTTDQFEHWLKQTADQEAPDLQEAIIAQYLLDQQIPLSPHFAEPLPLRLRPLLGLAATVALGLFGFSLLTYTPSEPVQWVDREPSSTILEDLLSLEQAETLEWLFHEGNRTTLVSYLPQ